MGFTENDKQNLWDLVEAGARTMNPNLIDPHSESYKTGGIGESFPPFFASVDNHAITQVTDQINELDLAHAVHGTTFDDMKYLVSKIVLEALCRVHEKAE